MTPPRPLGWDAAELGCPRPYLTSTLSWCLGPVSWVSLQDIQLGRVPRRRQMGTRGPSSGREDGEGRVWKGAVCARLACGSAQAAEVLNEADS